ncbi:unnamed protein product, partial [Meganyctiphanes norvegica]
MPRHQKYILFGIATGIIIPILLPFVHIGIISHLWDEFAYKVDARGCSNPCWDTVFKGPYERGPSGYKHVYFNATSNTFKIWAVTILFVILAYEACKRTVRLYMSGEMRPMMLVLLGFSIYPHYYSWWSYFNYWNDDFYRQWNHQLFFSITEMASTMAVVYLLDKNVSVTSARVLIIVDIAILHVASSGFDQFVDNVINGNGALHQVLRDIFFMIPDLLHISLPLLELRKVAKSRGLPITHIITTHEF